MKKTLLSLIGLSFFISVFSRSINKTEALNIATDFFSQISTTKSFNLKTATSNFDLEFTASNETDAQNYFYVYNIGENDGFIVISADSRTKSVLGYSNTGHFDADNIPINLQNWLKQYTDEIQYAIDYLSNDESTSNTSSNSNLLTSSVSPLLGNIEFNQGGVYNDSCPIYNGDETYTGCVATAIAQIMKYHEWPATGAGSHSYITETLGISLSANFGTTTYDWSNILDSYDGSETTAQIAAIARLMSHIGISVDMNYNTTGSGASTTDAAYSLYTYFNYDAAIQAYHKDYYSNDDWVDMLKSELDASRPILYAGSNSTSGHAFVCDGYDENNLFHFNWGWSGSSNGYYELSALTPGTQGIGSSLGGYSNNQRAVMAIQEPVSGSVHSQIIGLDSIVPDSTIFNKSSYSKLYYYGLNNIGGFIYKGSYEVGLYNTQDSLIDTISYYFDNRDTLKSGWGYTCYYIFYKLEDQDNGSYIIKPLYHNGTEYVKMPCSTGYDALQVEITSNKVYITKSSVPIISLSDSPTATSTLYQNSTGEFSISVQNTGDGDYNAQIGVKLVSTNDITVSQEIETALTQIKAGDTTIFTLSSTITVDAGTYYLKVYHDDGNDSTSTSFPTNLLDSTNLYPTLTVNEGVPTLEESNKSSEFKLLQNPVSNYVDVQLPENTISLSFYSLSGKCIKIINTNGVTTKTINVSDFANGIYIITLQTPTKKQTLRMVKK